MSETRPTRAKPKEKQNAIPKTRLKKCAKAVKVTTFVDYKEYLAEVYREAKETLFEFSYVKYSEMLGFGHNNVIYPIIQGQRTLTAAAAERVMRALGLTGTDRQYFENLVAVANGKSPDARGKHFQNMLSLKNRDLPNELDKMTLEFYSAWYHCVILEMIDLPGFRSDVNWIARRIKPHVALGKVKESLELLERIGFVRYDEAQKKYLRTTNDVVTGDEVVGMAIAAYHKRMIELGGESIVSVSPYERDISAVTARVSDELLNEIKREIHAFRKRIVAMTENCPDTNRVVQLNLQLFPLTNSVDPRGARTDEEN